MDLLSLGLGVVGLGLQIFGGMGQSSVAKQQAQVSGDIANQEQQINAQKQQQMQLESRRSTLQNFRQAQQLQARATANAVQGGAQLGSGLQGGLAGVTDTATENALGINQASQISTNIFGLNNKISADKQQLASLGGTAATDAGLASLGGSLIKSGPTIGAFGQDIGSGLSNLKWLSGGATGFLS